MLRHAAQNAGHPARVMLLFACGQDVRVVALAHGMELTIGRGEPADVRLMEPSLSRTHANVKREGSRVTITDLGSRNGVFVAGQLVQYAVLRGGDSAVLGSVTVSVQVLGGQDKAGPGGVATVTRDGPLCVSSKSPLILKSPAMVELQRIVERVAERTIPVLLLGETGTGKELVARELHRHSPRRLAPFIVVNCAAIPAGLVESTLFGCKRGAFTGADRDRAGAFEQASGGTLFLDEVGELAPGAQAALLRALDRKGVCPVGGSHEIEVDTRVVAATHCDLFAMTEQGRFRLDLYHRLNALTLELPPLRERREEIPELAEEFLRRFAIESGSDVRDIQHEAMRRLLAYDWPGNVRELRNAIERAVALADGPAIRVCDLPAALRGRAAPASEPGESFRFGDGLRAEVRGLEAMMIRNALERAHGNRRDAAHLLRLPLRTFERKLSSLENRGQACDDDAHG